MRVDQGLAVRYLLRWRVASAVLLIGTPMVDVVIIVLTCTSLAGGKDSDFTHGLAAFYVGVSLVLGPELIRRFDHRFARKYTSLSEEQLPTVPQRTSLAYWYRYIISSSVTIALLGVGIWIAGLGSSFWLIYWIIVAVFTVLMWGLLGPLRDRRPRTRRQREP